MAAGKRFKWTGSQVGVLVGFDTVTTDPITAVTKANPAVVTEVGHGRADGDVVTIQSVVGMTELNGGLFIIDVLSADTYALVGVDSTGYTTYTSGGEVNGGTFSNFCELTGYNRSGGSSPEIDATTLCSTEQEFELGLSDAGTTQLDFNFAPRTAIQLQLTALDKSKEKTAIRIVLPNNGGVMTQLGFVQQTSEQAGNGTLWTASVTIRNTGGRYDAPAAP